MRSTATLLAPLLAATVLAQNDYDLDKTTSGRVGSPLEMRVQNAPPGQFLLWVPSSTSGPTPLAAIDPLDPRWLSVGTDLLGSMVLQLTSGAGDAFLSVPLANNPSLSGIVLHWQTIVVLFGSPFFGQLGNDVVTQVGLQNAGVLAPATLANARGLAASFFDRDNNNGAGDVVISGGGTGSLTAATGLASTEVWDFRRMRRLPGPSMIGARALHLAVPLADGRVLLIGGAGATGNVLASCEIYDPATNSFAATGSMATPRILHAACRLADGRVMVAGGTSTVQPDAVAAIQAALSSVEIWNPTTGAWTAANPISGPRLGLALSLLPSGQVMVSGGLQYAPVFGVPNAFTVTTVQRWNPGTGTWTNGPNMAQPRAGHHYNQVQLLDGRILMTGSFNIGSILAATTATPGNGAEAYNPATNTWATYNMPTARVLHTATVLPDGRVVVAGGSQGTLSATSPIANVDVFQPATNTWSAAPALLAPRGGHCANLLPDGTLVLFGGQDATATVNTIETLRFY
jgi:hypothetical protein